MKYLFYALLLLSLASCSNEDAPTDLETNKYYADYLKIYNAYDSLGNEGTLKALNEYLEVYPERNDAYIFKAYVLAKMGNYEESNKFFEIAKELDSINIKTYEFQSSFMLYDSTKFAETRNIIEAGFGINDSSDILMNNLAWLQIFEGNAPEALKTVEKGLTFNANNPNLYRTGFLASVLSEDSLAKASYAIIIDSLQIASAEALELELRNQGPLHILKSLE